MSGDGKIVHNPRLRARIYSVAAGALTIAGVLGIVSTDDIDAGELADAAIEIIAVVSLVMARLNVWLRKPQLPPAPPPH